MNNSYNDDFSAWLRKNKYTIIWGLFLALLPVIVGRLLPILHIDTQDDNLIWNIVLYNLRHIVNIIFILMIFIALSKKSFLMDPDEEKEKAVHEYVKKQFGENSTLAQNTPSNLYERLRVGVRQFYYSWMAVWGVWLILYILSFVFSVYKYLIVRANDEAIKDFSDMTLFRMGSLLENFLNLINSIILLFIYLVITVSTVRVGNLSKDSNRIMHASLSVLVFVGASCLFIDMFSLSSSISPDVYKHIQYYLRLVIGIIAAISFMAVLGRLNTNFLNIPQWMMLSLYVYAAIQVIYSMTYDPYYFNPDQKERIIKIKKEMRDSTINANKTNELAIGKDTLYIEKYLFYNNCDSTGTHRVDSTNFLCDSVIIKAYICCLPKGKSPSKSLVDIIRKRESISKSENDSINNHYRTLIKNRDMLFPHIDTLEDILFYFAFLGKAFLFSVLLWINRGNRFLFFLIHKSNTLSDSEIMLRRFNKYYHDSDDKESE